MNLNLTMRAFHESLSWAFSPRSESVVPTGVSQHELSQSGHGQQWEGS